MKKRSFKDAFLIDHGVGLQEENGRTIPSSSSSSPDATVPGHNYEVFLSFRGVDIRKTFTDCLYQALVGVGVRTFRDNEELHVGKEIGPDLMRAITESKVSILIFTKGYASSKWCLKEVAQMVRCMEETVGEHMIMPIFFDVTPDEVQHQTGAYTESFAQHERQYGLEIVKEWRDALMKVTKLKGLELDKAASGNHGEFINLVVAEVLRELRKAGLNEGEIQVAMDNPAEEVIRLLEDHVTGARMVGMWGMGGIGKTTLAKHVYNRIIENFQRGSFLSDIRERSKSPSGLPQLQSILISDILGPGKYEFTGIHEGINVLKDRRLGSMKSFIVLDDVDHIDQLKALAGDLRWFGPGSRILVTTRDAEVLLRFQECSIYEVKPLDKDQSLELFLKHAFRNESVAAEFVGLSRDIAGTTGGLPLALEVIGSLLFVDRDRVDIWKEILKELKKQPHDDVQGKLKISYEALTEKQKKIFLDIACLFIGYDYKELILMWDDCGFSPTHVIEVLRRKSLIKIGNDNTLRMHDQLRDLGRRIVDQESEEEPGCRSRLWRQQEAEDVLLKKRGTPKVEAAFTIKSEEGVVFLSECFENLSNLRILQLSRGAVLAGDFQHLLPNLRWLRWRTPRLSRRLENVQLDNLVYLDLSRSSVGGEWSGWSSIKMVKLKVLDLSWCRKLMKSPPLSTFPNLERLILKDCHNLVRIDPSVKLLKKLNYLDVSDCYKLKSLPNEMAQLEVLIELKAPRSGVKEISIISLSSIKMRILKNLKFLSLEGCSKLENLPDQFAHLESLIELNVSQTGVKTIPVSSRMKKLKTLYANNCSRLERLPNDITTLPLLQTLDLRSCGALDNLPELPRSLTNLKVGAHSVGCWGNMEGLVNLKELQLCGGSVRWKPQQNPNEQAMAAKFRRLEKLVLSYVKSCYIPKEIFSSPQMKEIEIDSCEGLEWLPQLSSNLLSLRVRECPLLQRLPNLSNLTKLSKLYIGSCPMLSEIEGLSDLTALESLLINGFHSNVIDGVDRLSSLRVLTIGGCDGIESLPADLSNLQMLRQLYLIGNRKLVDIQGIGNLSSLVQLTLAGCRAVEHLPLSKLHSLRELDLSGCEQLRALEGLEDLNSLRALYVERCNAIEEPLPLPPSLVKLIVRGCEKLPDAWIG